MSSFHVVIPAGGSGSRSGQTQPKQFVSLGGRSMLAHTLAVFATRPDVQSITLALPNGQTLPLDVPEDPRIRCCQGGQSRRDSVLKACQHLQNFASGQDWVMVHDAARPVVVDADLDALLAALIEYRAAYLVAPVADTLRDKSGQTLDRDQIHRVLTPQCARLVDLLMALDHPELLTDDVDYLQRAGIYCQPVMATQPGIKVTYPTDWAVAQALLEQLR